MGWVQDFIFLSLVLIKPMGRWGEFKISLRDPRGEKILLAYSLDSAKILRELSKNIGNVFWK